MTRILLAAFCLLLLAASPRHDQPTDDPCVPTPTAWQGMGHPFPPPEWRVVMGPCVVRGAR